MHRLRERCHELLGEMYGDLAGKCLSRVAKHAEIIRDDITHERVRKIIDAGIAAGWDDRDPTRYVRANRPAEGKEERDVWLTMDAS